MDVRSGPVGVFDSGVGGLAVLWQLQRLLPAENLLYFADQAHFPYGSRGAADVRALALAAARLLAERGAKLIVVACNTASSAALPELRRRFAVPIVGIEPAVKPACALTRRRRIGVLATDGTLQGEALDALVARVAAGVEVVRVAAGGLVELVERGAADTAEAVERVSKAVRPMRDAGVDVVALGCTHYAFLQDTVERCMGPGVTVLEPGEAVARQAARLLARCGLAAPANRAGRVCYETSGDYTALARSVSLLRSAETA